MGMLGRFRSSSSTDLTWALRASATVEEAAARRRPMEAVRAKVAGGGGDGGEASQLGVVGVIRGVVAAGRDDVRRCHAHRG